MGCGASSAARGQAEPRLSRSNIAGGISKRKFISANAGNIEDFYEMDKQLGQGSFGWVCKGTNIKTRANYAIKAVAKDQLKDVPEFQQEIAIMKMMDHPNIIKLYETFEDEKNIYLVMELCSGGELFERIVEAGHFTESQCAIIMAQIIRAINYMHDNNICHRDLKPENFLFTSKEGPDVASLKIIDFGLSCQYREGEVLTLKAGTADYVAPQVLNGEYDNLSDMWSVGVIMYVMLCGYPPFYADSQEEVLTKVYLGNFDFDPKDWKGISEDAKDLIRMLLKRNPKERFTAQQALKHKWIQKRAPNSTDVSIVGNLANNLRDYRSHNKLKKAALHIIANQLSEETTRRLSQTFLDLDRNGDGQVTVEEMKVGLRKAGVEDIANSANIIEYMKAIDTDCSGAIDYTEFLAATVDERTYTHEDACWEAFRKFDKAGAGHITLEDLKAVLGDEHVKDMMGDQSAEDIMGQVDADNSGSISFDEFVQMMRR